MAVLFESLLLFNMKGVSIRYQCAAKACLETTAGLVVSGQHWVTSKLNKQVKLYLYPVVNLVLTPDEGFERAALPFMVLDEMMLDDCDALSKLTLF
jgi:hypothetical protein